MANPKFTVPEGQNVGGKLTDGEVTTNVTKDSFTKVPKKPIGDTKAAAKAVASTGKFNGNQVTDSGVRD